jgi:hypothetical protein
MNNDDATPTSPSWGALDRIDDELHESAFIGLYSHLTDDQLRRALEADARGEALPTEVAAACERVPRGGYCPPEIASMTDDELRAQLERDLERIRAEHPPYFPPPMEAKHDTQEAEQD